MTPVPVTVPQFRIRHPPRHGAWWIPDESPGGLGEGEVWIDESAMDMYGRGDAEPAVTVTGGRDPGVSGRSWWLGAIIRFERFPGLARPAAYSAVTRRRGPGKVNLGRPYYVLRLNG